MKQAGKPLLPWQQESVHMLHAVTDSGLWVCQDYAEWVARQNGKGVILEARALTGFLMFDGKNGRPLEELISWSAHEYKTAMEAFRRVRSLLRRLGTPINPNLIDFGEFQVKISNTNGDESFERMDTEQRIKFIARSKGSGRGFTGDCQIVDETFAYTNAQQDALAPTGLAVTNAQTIYMSTPPLSGDTAGPMYTVRERADAGGDSTLGYRDWGLGGYLEDLNPDMARLHGVEVIDVDDPALWAKCCPSLGFTIKMESLVKLRRKLGKIGFGREVLGLWPYRIDEDEAEDVITTEQWEALIDPHSQIEGPPVFALDMPWDRSSVVIATGGSREDDKRHVEIVEQRSGSFWVIPWLRERLLRWQPHAVLIDAVGPIASMVTDLEPLVEEAGIDFVKVQGPEMTRSCGEFYRDVNEQNLRHLGQPILTDSLKVAKKSDIGDVWRWDRKDSSSDISPLVAATLADHGATIYAGQGAFNIW
jgi:hypothetical protein